MDAMEKGTKENTTRGGAASPAQLDALIGTASPGVWGFLVGTMALLVATCIWGAVGHLETRVRAAALCEEGTLTCFVKEEKAEAIRPGMTVRVEGQHYLVGEVAEKPTPLTEDAGDHTLELGGLTDEDWVVEVRAACDLPNGVYTADIVTESVTPFSFIIN